MRREMVLYTYRVHEVFLRRNIFVHPGLDPKRKNTTFILVGRDSEAAEQPANTKTKCYTRYSKYMHY